MVIFFSIAFYAFQSNYTNHVRKSIFYFPQYVDETTEAESVLPCNTISYEAWIVLSVGCHLGSQLEAKGGTGTRGRCPICDSGH